MKKAYTAPELLELAVSEDILWDSANDNITGDVTDPTAPNPDEESSWPVAD